ncbi:sentrin-specific protease 1, partial [Phenoliferia sp. Uapishka_3]
MPEETFIYDAMKKQLDEAEKEDDVPAAPKRRAFPAKLSPQDQKLVDSIYRESGTISSMPGGEVKAGDIKRLKGLTWINDEIVTFFAVMINARTKAMLAGEGGLVREDFVKAYSFTSFFYTKFETAGYAGVKRWSKKVDLFDHDVVIIPINCNNMHWVCSAINVRQKRFEYYDSLGNQNPKVYANLRSYLAQEHLDKKKKAIDLSEWTDYWYDDIPIQNNSSDCGIFTCQFMESLSRGVEEFDFTQQQMPYFRNKMVLELKKKEFLLEPWKA